MTLSATVDPKSGTVTVKMEKEKTKEEKKGNRVDLIPYLPLSMLELPGWTLREGETKTYRLFDMLEGSVTFREMGRLHGKPVALVDVKQNFKLEQEMEGGMEMKMEMGPGMMMQMQGGGTMSISMNSAGTMYFCPDEGTLEKLEGHYKVSFPVMLMGNMEINVKFVLERKQ